MSRLDYGLVALSAALVLFLALAILPRFVVRQLPPSALAGIGDPTARFSLENERLKLRNEVRTTCVSLLGSVGLVAGVLITFQQFRSSQDALAESLETSREQLRVAQQSANNEQYIDNVKNLGDPHAAVRVAAIEVLDDIAQRGDTERIEVHSILEAFLHERVPWPPAANNPYPAGADAFAIPQLKSRHPEVYIALVRLGQRNLTASTTTLQHRDLRRANLSELDYTGDVFIDVHMAGGWLNGADLRDATFEESDLSGVDLTGAKLCAADLLPADLTGAILTGAMADDTTTWPQGFDPDTAGVLQAESAECTAS